MTPPKTQSPTGVNATATATNEQSPPIAAKSSGWVRSGAQTRAWWRPPVGRPGGDCREHHTARTPPRNRPTSVPGSRPGQRAGEQRIGQRQQQARGRQRCVEPRKLVQCQRRPGYELSCCRTGGCSGRLLEALGCHARNRSEFETKTASPHARSDKRTAQQRSIRRSRPLGRAQPFSTPHFVCFRPSLYVISSCSPSCWRTVCVRYVAAMRDFQVAVSTGWP